MATSSCILVLLHLQHHKAADQTFYQKWAWLRSISNSLHYGWNPSFHNPRSTTDLDNIAPKYRSSLGVNQLFAVLKTRILEKYGCEQVLEFFMLQLRKCGIWLVCFH